MRIRFENAVKVSLFTLGFSALTTQIFLIRECFSVLNGNELVIGIVLANWMLLTGAGAFLGRFYRIKEKITFLLFLQFIFALLPILTLLKLDLWKAFSIPAGSIPGLLPVIVYMFLFQLPFCLLNGFLFVANVNVLSEISGKNTSAVSYATESAGGMLAGIVVNLFIIRFSDVFDGLRVLLILNLLVCILCSITCGIRLQKFVLIPGCLVFMALPFLTDLDSYTSRLFYPAQKLVFHKNTPYGKLDVTMASGQLNYFENGLLLFSSGNEILNEESVHFAMIQHPDPRKILLISGGISGAPREIFKYRPERIDYVELDPGLIKLGRRYTTILDDDRIHIIRGDARRFIRQTKEKYDVVLINLPEPSTLLINRYYSREFLLDLKRVLSPGGVISESLSSASDYVSKTAARTNSILYQTLKTQFRNVLILPGQKNYFLASDSSLTREIAERIAVRGIKNLFVNSFYLDQYSIDERSEYIFSHLDKNAEVNSDFRPVAFFQQIRYWSSMFEWNSLGAGIIILVLLVLILISLNKISFGLFTGGFTASSLQLLILVSFQVIYGYVFLATGMIIALFMGGIALGAFSFPRMIPVPTEMRYIHLQLTLAMFSFGFPFILLVVSLPGIPFVMIQVVFFLLTFILSFITGLEFSLASSIGKKDVTQKMSSNYSADLFGSAIGAILTTLVLLPFLGLKASCFVLVAINIFSAVLLYLRRNKV